MTRLYLIRHGAHDLLGKALAGRMPDVHLNSEGRVQARRLARYFAERDVTTILTSPLERCLETADPIAQRLALTATIDGALNEINCGAWTGESFEMLDLDPRWHLWNSERHRAMAPGGETMQAVQHRMMALVDRFGAEDREPMVLVSHSDLIKAAIASVLGSPLEWHDRLQIDPGSITTIDLWAGGGKVLRLNEVPSP